MSHPAAPPSKQEIYRKLSVHSPKTPKSTNTPSLHVHDGTESDSDSALLTPEIPSISTHPGSASASANPPLSAIAERRSGSAESEDDEDDEEEGGWKTAYGHGKRKGSAEEEGVIKAGYLWKKGERRKAWKKRWFVLRPAHLAYYKTSAEYQLLRLLDLADVHSCTAIALKKHPHTIGLVSPVRTFYLQAETQEEVHEWIEAIEGARQTLLTTSTQSSLVKTVPRPGESPSIAQQQLPVIPPPPSHAYVTSSDSEVSLNTHRPTPASKAPTSDPPPQSAASKDLPKIVLSGYLMKCGSKRRNWRKRWFVLNGEKLIYSASHMDTKPHREFAFSQIVDALGYDLPPKITSASPPTTSPPPHPSTAADDGDDAHKAHTFKIVTTKRTLLLCAPSEEEEIKWLGAISALIARRSGLPGNPGGVTKTTNPEAVSSNTATAPKGKAGRISATATESSALEKHL